MKRSVLAIITLAMVTLWTAEGFSSEAEHHGMILGAGSGAIIGHAIGGNAEAAIIGSAIGGIVGVAIGNAHGYGLPLPPPFIVPPPYPKYSRHPHKRHGKYRPRCRVVEKTIYKHGHPYSITKRICKEDRGHYRDRHHRRDNRDYYSSRYNNHGDSYRGGHKRIDRHWNQHFEMN